MCEYYSMTDGFCKVQNAQCPYGYFCTKVQAWKPSKSMPTDCPMKAKAEMPKGYYLVRQERKGYLYVEIDGFVYKIANPFEDVPRYVKARKLKNGEWKLRK